MKKANASAKTCSRHQRVVRTSLPAACGIVVAVAALNSPNSWADTSFDVTSGSSRTEPGSYTIGELTQYLTTVNANSRLQLSGNLTGNVRVRSGGTLEGSWGTVHGNVVNNGDVDVYIGSTLKINGNYTQNLGSTLTTHMNGQEVLTYAPGKLSVTGTATLNGGMVRPVASYGIYSPSYQYPILHADQGITGAFEGIIQPAVVKFAVEYDADNAYLVVIGSSPYAFEAATKNQRALGTLLDSTPYFGSTTDRFYFFGYYFGAVMESLPPAEFQQALEENNPAIFDAFTSVSFDSTAAYLSATSRGFHHLGLSPSAASSTAPMAFDDISPQASSGQPLHLSINPPAPASDPNLTLWASGISNWSGQHNSSQARGDDVFTSGVAVGGDYRISPSASVGLSLGYTHSDIDWQEDTATGNGQTGYGSLYGNWADSGFWADAILGMGLSWYDATRNIPTFGRSADSDFTAQEYFARLGGGYDWKVGRWTAGPIGSLQYINSQQGSFSETGADSLDLTVDDRDANSLQSGLGLRAGYTIDVGRTRLTPSVRAQWVHEYFNDPRAIDASIAGAGDAQFRVHGDAPTRDSALLGLGLDASMTQSVALYLDFESLLPLDGEQLTTYSLVGGLRWQF